MSHRIDLIIALQSVHFNWIKWNFVIRLNIKTVVLVALFNKFNVSINAYEIEYISQSDRFI